MSGDPQVAWAQEIRDYLLGRLEKDRQSVPLAGKEVQRLRHAPVRRWWIFEGKSYPSIGGTLSTRWPQVVRTATLLERTFNPRLRLSERPDGVVDWAQTLARGPLGLRREYVLRSSAVGLGPDERAALQGWIRWIIPEWRAYAKRFDLRMPEAEEAALGILASNGRDCEATEEQLRQWVHVARRSRWPLLRDLVAETIRVVIEPSALDHIPLPTDWRLFELLCLVRVARHLAPPPDELRWLDPDLTGNQLILIGATCWYQQPLVRETVLDTPEFEGGLAEVVDLFHLRVPKFVDLAIDLEPPRRGIDGILIEAKSGTQNFDDAVAQLRSYRRARPRPMGGRFLVWGIVENPEGGEMTSEQLNRLRQEIDHGTGDVWAFSGADSIGAVLELLGCDPRAA